MVEEGKKEKSKMTNGLIRLDAGKPGSQRNKKQMENVKKDESRHDFDPRRILTGQFKKPETRR